jgi:alanyl-tRNA synthetase
VRPDKLRFDFTHPQALTPEERADVERRVNEKVFENLPVRTYVTSIDEARKLGATMLFGEKYGDEVRVVEIAGYSRELCGGTHVRSTAEIGPFEILSESSIGTGVRRIEAVTAGEAYALLHTREREVEELRAELERVRKEARKPRADKEQEFVVRWEGQEDGVNVVIAEVTGGTPEDLLTAADVLKGRNKPAAVVVGSAEEGRVHLVASIDKSLEDRLDAVEWVRAAAQPVGGGGGGRRTMARAGGKDPDKLPEAFDSAREWIKSSLR